MATTPTETFTQIIVKNDDLSTWQSYDDVNHKLGKGEPAAVWKVKLNPDGQPLFQADGVTPQTDKLLFEVMGDGFSTFSQLEPIWPVPKGVFNSVVSGRQGAARDITGDITKTNATLNFNTFAEMIDAWLHPYAKPAFSSFNPASYPALEVGIAHDPNLTYSWASTNSQNVAPGSVQIKMNFAGSDTLITTAGMNGSGSIARTGLATRAGTSIGQKLTYTLSGQNTKGEAMTPVTRTRTWEAKRALFMHPDTEWLINGMTAKVGDPVDTADTSDATVAAIINQHLDATGTLGNGLFGTTQNGKANVVDLDGGTGGARAYIAIPKAYRSTASFIDPSFNVAIAPSLSREVTVSRNGVDVVYVLIGLDLRIVQILKAQLQ